MKKIIPPYRVINWDSNKNGIEFYDIMPYLVDCWKEEKKRKHKTWNLSYTDKDKEIDDTKMPETFNEFKKFVNDKSRYNFWGRCEYEVIVTEWPPRPRRDEKRNIKMFNYDVYLPEKYSIPTIDFYDQKLDVHQQIKMNLDIVTKHFMDYINS